MLLSLTPTGPKATCGAHLTGFFDSSFDASDLLVDKEIVNSKKAKKDVL